MLFVADIKKRLELGTVGCEPRVTRYFALNIEPIEDISIVIDGHDKFNALE